MDSEGRSGSGQSLYDVLTDKLPKDQKFWVHHVSTPPTRCDPLFAPPPGRKPDRTYCETHFLTVSVALEPSNGTREQVSVLVFAIEALVYTTKFLTTIFISKADSTGYLAHWTTAQQGSKSSSIRTVTSVFISWLAKTRQRSGIRLVVSLFARAQDQYLFPGSVENKGKHVLDDRQLVKWWCKTLDPVLREKPTSHPDEAGGEQDTSGTTSEAYVIVPGFDKHETTAFFPPSWRSDPAEARKWRFGHPLRDITQHPTAPPRCLVPRFPDDPKARYVDELDDELPSESSSQTQASPSKKGNGMWKSIKTLEQFWEMMAFRQECSSGRLVGFVWLVFTPPDIDTLLSDNGIDSQMSGSSTPMAGHGELPSIDEMLSQSSTARTGKDRIKRTRLTGPIVPRQPKIKSSSNTLPTSSQAEESNFWKWPASSRGQVVLEKEVYDRVHELLLRLDFADSTAAIQSTKKWLDEVATTANSPTPWGRLVIGRRTEAHVPAATTAVQFSAGRANDLSGMVVRKKRKADPTSNEAAAAPPASVPAVNELGSGLIRKKPKIA